MSLGTGDTLLLVAAGLGAGTVNGVAGGGTLVSFPALLAVGLPALGANVTSTVGICPGYLGGVAGFRSEVRSQPRRCAVLSVPAIAGAVAGSILLLVTPQSAFRSLVPYLVLAACALFAAQPFVAKQMARHAPPAPDRAPSPTFAAARQHLGVAGAGTFLGSVYGGYFGAGLGVVLLALLGLALPDDLVRTNGLRSVLSLVVNIGAALVFIIHAHVAWGDAGLLAGSSLVGGYGGARIARRLPPTVFRVLVIGLGVATAATLLAG
jgi:uncharacterized membrane protein YfcA